MSSVTAPAALAVWGSPIAHSRSPQLHAAAYEVLGLPWTYDRREVTVEGFPRALEGLDGRWRGLSLTMPLKERAFEAVVQRDRRAELTGAVNTLLLTDRGQPRGVNTDVGGLVRAMQEEGIDRVETGRLIGAGATAASALVALGELGARRVDVLARRPPAAEPLVLLGARLGTEVVVHQLDGHEAVPAEVTIATLPGGTVLESDVAARAADGGGMLLDAAYSPWPSALARSWESTGAPARSGRGMLLHQAVLQVRFFVAGDVEAVLTDEDSVVAAMRAALMGD
ncbi:shikimate dehydrogenase [Microbacterium sp. LRZ72]|uniref:shikimate dehydrogenase family protein n=1 Tax=Microbacterium sp. LRZ72 TaxID=2942481 RepID=UPI0029A61A37|nr:shikimate dehydrogenase [Microbacterium sp. LRZ72]MDX2375378.1 shikimate dehydrogenase [Microbacterium sp. LRZ72]